MYLTATRSDIRHSASLISRFMENLKEFLLLSAKRILRYLKGTVNFGLLYKKDEDTELIVFSNSDYAGDFDEQKSTSCYMLMLSPVSWSSIKQPIVTLSTTEVDFVAASACPSQAIWLRNILTELHFNQQEATQIYCDNRYNIKLSIYYVFHGRSKHIDVRCHYLRDLTNDKVIDLMYYRSEDQVTEIF